MLSVAKLALGQEAYYEQQVAAGVDDYYAGRGESPGIWAGQGAAGLGLVGVVVDGDLGTLLRGVDPASGRTLRAPVRERTITVRVLDTKNGVWREERKRLAPVSGYDLVFSCPKSVSLVHALTADERVRRLVSEAHEAAWQAALEYLEREACVVRRGRGGAIREHGAGFVAAAFRHRTSRAQDPHLHTHVIVANMTQAADGEWRALDGDAILKTYRLAAGYLYETHLRGELTRRLGVQWTEPVKGMAELDGVPEEALRAFSTRRRSVVEHMQALGTTGFAAARVAALTTREAKEHVDLPRLREQWAARAAEHGLGHDELRALFAHPPDRRCAVDRRAVAARLLAPDGLTAHSSTFTMPELVCGVAGSLRGGAGIEHVLETADRISRLAGVELVAYGGAPGRPARYTTRELIRLERDTLGLAIAGRDADAPRPETAIVRRALLRSRAVLTEEQRRLVHEAALQPDRVVCVVGVAGSGKTTALRTLAEAYRDSGTAVLGAAPSGRAADELAHAAGIPTTTLHGLLLDATQGRGLPKRCVLVVDEAGMAETRVLAPLLRMVDQAGGKAILVGDPAQLPAVGAGGLYSALCDRLGTITLTATRRQHDPFEREALARLRAGDPEPYLGHVASRGRLHLDDDPTTAKQRLLEDWWQTAEHDLADTVMLAYRRHDVRDLNRAAHALMLDTGRLGAEAVRLGEREFRVGDRVACRRNDRRLSIRNGTRGRIIDLHEPTQSLTLRTDAGSVRVLPAAYAFDHLDHAYALTGHAAEGATVNHAFVLLPDAGALQEWGYVACSRARSETRLYLADTPGQRDAIGHDPSARDVSRRVALALSTSSAEHLALEQAEPAATPSLPPVERRRVQEWARAETRLAGAEARLLRLGWRNRRQRTELTAEVALQRAALRIADQGLGALRHSSAPGITPKRESPSRRTSPPAQARSVRAREAPELGLDM